MFQSELESERKKKEKRKKKNWKEHRNSKSSITEFSAKELTSLLGFLVCFLFLCYVFDFVVVRENVAFFKG